MIAERRVRALLDDFRGVFAAVARITMLPRWDRSCGSRVQGAGGFEPRERGSVNSVISLSRFIAVIVKEGRRKGVIVTELE